MMTSQVLRALEQRRLITRAADPDDSRALRLSVTEPGARLALKAIQSVEAADALTRAGGRAERRESLREARRYYTRALEVLGDAERERQLALRVRRADIMTALGELVEACEELVDVAERAHELRRIDVEAEALMLLGDIDQRQGRAAEAGRRLATAEVMAEAVGDPALKIRVAFVHSALRADFHGEVDQALNADGHLRLSAILINRGDLAEAEIELRRCLELASELGSHRLEAEATSWLGLVRYFLGHVEEAERLCRQAHDWFERTGDTYFQVQNIAHHGLAAFAFEDGRFEQAERLLREALPIALQIGGWVMMETYRHLIEVLVAQGRLEDARDLLSFASRNLPEEDAYARACLLLSEATVATAAVEPTAAATAYAEALRVIEQLDWPLELGEARLALARSLRAFGDLNGARTELNRARSIFARIGAVTPRLRIDAELSELSEGPAKTGPSAR